MTLRKVKDSVNLKRNYVLHSAVWEARFGESVGLS